MKLESYDVICVCIKRLIGIFGYYLDIFFKEVSVCCVLCFESSGVVMIGCVVLVLVLWSVVK